MKIAQEQLRTGKPYVHPKPPLQQRQRPQRPGAVGGCASGVLQSRASSSTCPARHVSREVSPGCAATLLPVDLQSGLGLETMGRLLAAVGHDERDTYIDSVGTLVKVQTPRLRNNGEGCSSRSVSPCTTPRVHKLLRGASSPSMLPLRSPVSRAPVAPRLIIPARSPARASTAVRGTTPGRSEPSSATPRRVTQSPGTPRSYVARRVAGTPSRPQIPPQRPPPPRPSLVERSSRPRTSLPVTPRASPQSSVSTACQRLHVERRSRSNSVSTRAEQLVRSSSPEASVAIAMAAAAIAAAASAAAAAAVARTAAYGREAVSRRSGQSEQGVARADTRLREEVEYQTPQPAKQPCTPVTASSRFVKLSPDEEAQANRVLFTSAAVEESPVAESTFAVRSVVLPTYCLDLAAPDVLQGAGTEEEMDNVVDALALDADEEATSVDLSEPCEHQERNYDPVLPYPPDGFCSWDWPMSRPERKARVQYLDQQLHCADKRELFQRLVEVSSMLETPVKKRRSSVASTASMSTVDTRRRNSSG